MKTVNLISFDLKTYIFDIEHICKETGANIRYLGIPYQDSDATMYHFFQYAYPSQLQNIKFSDMGKHLKSDAPSSKNYYTEASQLSYQNICYLTRDLICKNTESETKYFLSKIYDWLNLDALTLIDFPRIITNCNTISSNKKTQQIKYIIEQLDMRYNCIAVNYMSCLDKTHQTDISKAIALRTPYICWNGTRDPSAKSLLDQVQYDETDYQKRIIELINEKVT